MKLLQRLLAVGILASVAATSAPAQVTTVAGGSLAASLPADTVLFIKVKDIESLRGKIEKMPMMALLGQPQYAGMMAELQKGWATAKREVQSEAGVDLEELLNAFKGEASIAIGDIKPLAETIGQALSTLEEPEIKPESVPVLISVDTKSGKANVLKSWNKLLSKAKEEGVQVSSAAFKGGKITTLGRPENSSDGPEGFYVAEMGNRFYLSMSKDYIQKTMSGQGGLLGAADFKTSTTRAGLDGDFFVYMNLEALTGAVDGALSQSMFAFFWQKFHSLFIGKSLKNVATSMVVEPTGLRSKTFINNGGTDEGFIGWFKTTEIPAKPSGLVPDGVKSFTSAGINGQKVIRALREVASTAMAFQGGGDIDALFEQQFGLKLDDLERSMGSRIHSFVSEAGGEDNPAGDMSLVMELTDDGPLKKLMGIVQQMSGGALQASPYLDRQVLSMDTGAGFSPGMTVTDKLFILSLQKSNVEKVIQRIGKDASAPPAGFKKLAGSIPAKVASISYTDAEYFEATFKNLAGMLSQAGGDVPENLDDLLMAIGKTMGSAVGYSKWEAKGLYSESWMDFQKN